MLNLDDVPYGFGRKFEGKIGVEYSFVMRGNWKQIKDSVVVARTGIKEALLSHYVREELSINNKETVDLEQELMSTIIPLGDSNSFKEYGKTTNKYWFLPKRKITKQTSIENEEQDKITFTSQIRKNEHVLTIDAIGDFTTSADAFYKHLKKAFFEYHKENKFTHYDSACKYYLEKTKKR